MLTIEENGDKKLILKEKLEKSLEMAEKLDPENIETQYLLSKHYIAKGEEEKSIEMIEKLCKISFEKKQIEYIDSIAFLSFENKMYSAAKKGFENLLYHLENVSEKNDENLSTIGKF